MIHQILIMIIDRNLLSRHFLFQAFLAWSPEQPALLCTQGPFVNFVIFFQKSQTNNIRISFVRTNCFLRVQSNFKNEIWVQNSLTLLREHKVCSAMNQVSCDTSAKAAFHYCIHLKGSDHKKLSIAQTSYFG